MTFGLCAGAGRVQAGEVAASAGVRASDCLARARRRSVSRLGVHSADINEIAVEVAGEDRWNSAVLPRWSESVRS